MQGEQAIPATSHLAVDRSCEVHKSDIKYLNCSYQSREQVRCLLSVWKLEVAKSVRVYPVLQLAHLTNMTIKEFGVVRGMRSAQRFCWRMQKSGLSLRHLLCCVRKQLRLDFAICAITLSQLL